VNLPHATGVYSDDGRGEVARDEEPEGVDDLESSHCSYWCLGDGTARMPLSANP
jgi:hypothetical protein